ncbi:hypothetical protein [Salipaludibacillus sp. CF4.18]|uniref:hypothetical protein n=1 Tax=Salipaludibacillus sp. CF4.18 TaxID=3373081 RepID=UPI003EE428D6
MLAVNKKNFDIETMYWFIKGNQCKIINVYTKSLGKVYVAYMNKEIIVYYFDNDHVIKHLLNSPRSQLLLKLWKPEPLSENDPNTNNLENILLDMLHKDEWTKMPKGQQV